MREKKQKVERRDSDYDLAILRCETRCSPMGPQRSAASKLVNDTSKTRSMKIETAPEKADAQNPEGSQGAARLTKTVSTSGLEQLINFSAQTGMEAALQWKDSADLLMEKLINSESDSDSEYGLGELHQEKRCKECLQPLPKTGFTTTEVELLKSSGPVTSFEAMEAEETSGMKTSQEPHKIEAVPKEPLSLKRHESKHEMQELWWSKLQVEAKNSEYGLEELRREKRAKAIPVHCMEKTFDPETAGQTAAVKNVRQIELGVVLSPKHARSEETGADVVYEVDPTVLALDEKVVFPKSSE